MRGYLIDVIEGKTHSVDVFDLEDYQKFIHCQTIDIVSRTIGDREYEIICDDEGLSKRPALVSAVNNDGQPMLVGNLIVMGNSGGDEDMHEISFDEIQHLKKHFMHVVTKGSGPIHHYTSRWTMEDQQRLQQVMQYSIYRYSYSAYRKGIYSERNQQLIDGSNYCIYYSDSKTAPYTQSIIDYAIDNGIWTTNLADNLLWGADDYFEHL